MPSIQFKGKSIVHSHHLTVPYHQLVPHDKKSVLVKGERASLQGNLIVQGDNLTALKALLPSFAGKVKCIYIDPPYNTGNEGWAYNDNVNHPMLQEWLGKTVDKEDLTRHDKWLCMMTPRLKLLHELLRDDGVIFISIDDNEVHHLRQLMDEIFGEENFLQQVIWKKRNGPPNDKVIGAIHEYMLVYARNQEVVGLYLRPRTDEQISRYKNPDNHPKGEWVAGDLMANVKGGRYVESLRYAITNPNTGQKHWPGKDGNWRFNGARMNELITADEIWFGSDGKGRPKLKRFLADVKEGTAISTIWDELPFNDEGTAEIVSIIGNQTAFDTPKPTELIREVIRLGANSNDIILDSFAGSGTTAHAVLALNAEDGGNRRFVLVEQEDYGDTITAERVRRVIKGVKGAKDEALKRGLGGTFSYFTLGESFEAERLLSGGLPSYLDLARFVFFTATGEQLDERAVDEDSWYLGESKRYSVFLIYRPDMAFLKTSASALTLPFVVDDLPAWKPGDKPRLIIASHKYLDEDRMADFRIEFCQLPWGIYRYKAG